MHVKLRVRYLELSPLTFWHPLYEAEQGRVLNQRFRNEEAEGRHKAGPV